MPVKAPSTPGKRSVRQPCYSSACSPGKARCSLQEAQNASSPRHGPLVWVFPCFFLVCGGDSELSENLKYTFLRCLCLSTNYPRGHFMSAVRITSKSRESPWEPELQCSPSNRQLKVFCTVKLPLPLAGDRVALLQNSPTLALSVDVSPGSYKFSTVKCSACILVRHSKECLLSKTIEYTVGTFIILT